MTELRPFLQELPFALTHILTFLCFLVGFVTLLDRAITVVSSSRSAKAVGGAIERVRARFAKGAV